MRAITDGKARSRIHARQSESDNPNPRTPVTARPCLRTRQAVTLGEDPQALFGDEGPEWMQQFRISSAPANTHGAGVSAVAAVLAQTQPVCGSEIPVEIDIQTKR